jgi:hypothetical protein
VSGGGGAFAHPTHDLKKHLTVDGVVAGRTLFDKGGIRSVQLETEAEPAYQFKAEKFYPSRGRSRLLALKNVWMPFHNRRFALLMGFVYFLYAWVFGTSVPAQFKMPPSESIFDLEVASAAAVAATARASPVFFFMLLGLFVGLVFYVDAKLKHPLWRWLNGPIRVAFGTVHFLFHIWALLLVSALAAFLALNLFDPAIGVALLYAKILVADVVGGTADAVLDKMAACVSKLDWGGSVAGWKCVPEHVGTDALYIGLTALAYATTSILIGGLIGAFIFGCYWVVTSVVFGMHQDAFSALAIKDYKNFLRMKFEENRLTIYPIAVDHIPGWRKWRAWDEKKDAEEHKHRPLLVTDRDMKPRLIEEPIVIRKGAPPPLAKMKARGS